MSESIPRPDIATIRKWADAPTTRPTLLALCDYVEQCERKFTDHTKAVADFLNEVSETLGIDQAADAKLTVDVSMRTLLDAARANRQWSSDIMHQLATARDDAIGLAHAILDWESIETPRGLIEMANAIVKKEIV